MLHRGRGASVARGFRAQLSTGGRLDTASIDSLADRAATQLVLPGVPRAFLGGLTLVAQVTEQARVGGVRIAEGVAFVQDRARELGLLSQSSLGIYSGIWRGFARHAELASRCETLDRIDARTVSRFLAAPTRGGGTPSSSTRQLRRTALRHLFRILRDAGLIESDPSLDLSLPARARTDVRALTDAEVDRCRAASLATMLSRREPLAWALAESGALMSELAGTKWAGVDVVAGILEVNGDRNGVRAVPLTPWASQQLGRLKTSDDLETSSLLGFPSSAPAAARRAQLTQILQRTMRRAGVRGPGVSARSVAAWVGAMELQRTGRIDLVAVHLGVGSLDAAAALVGFEWRNS